MTKKESLLVVEIWEIFRDIIPHNRKNETATLLLRAFEEYGFEKSDLTDLVDEDPYISRAYKDVYDDHDQEDFIDDEIYD